MACRDILELIILLTEIGSCMVLRTGVV